MQSAPQGSTITLSAEFRDGNGVLTDPSEVSVAIIDPAGDVVVPAGVASKVADGVFSYAHLIASNADLGIWVAEWSVTLETVELSTQDPFEITAFGTSAVDESTSIEQWPLGSVVTFELVTRDADGNLANLDSPLLDLIDPDGDTVQSALVPTSVATGVLRYSWTTNTTFATGIWVAEWSGTLDSVEVSTQEAFELIPAETTLVTVAQYRRITKDNTSQTSDVQEHLVDAQRLIEEYLRRPLTVAERTETLRVIEGVVYPVVTPIISADYEIKDNYLVNPETDLSFTSYELLATVTYVGGYTTDTLPIRLREAIARTAYEALFPAVANSSVQVGVTSVKNGDVAVSYGTSGYGSETSSLLNSVRAQIRAYMRREP